MRQVQKLSDGLDRIPEGTHTLDVPVSETGDFLVNFPLKTKTLGALVIHREGEIITLTSGDDHRQFQIKVAERDPDGNIANAIDVFAAPVSNVTLWRSGIDGGWEVDAAQNGITEPTKFKQFADVALFHLS
jgi:hypothetical protein